MHALRKRFGLILFAALWTTILLVPLWRWRAGNQIREMNTGFDFSAGLSPREELEAARRFPDDAKAQFAPLRRIIYDETTRAIGGVSHDTRVDDAYFARYDELQRRFPDANFGRIQRLRDICRGGFGIDQGPIPTPISVPVGAPASASASAPSSGSGAPVPVPASVPTARPAPWFSAKQREAALVVAREGARHEPDNGFFPWMEAVLEFSFDRDEQALKAMEKAGRCASWSDDTLGTPRRRLEVLARLRPVGVEDELSEWFTMLLPHLAPMRAAARASLWRAKQFQQRGQKERAWDIIASVQRAAGVVATHADDSILSRLVGQNVCVQTWNFALTGQLDPPLSALGTNFFNPTPAEIAAQEQSRRVLADKFAVYASAHGHANLGHEAQSLALQMDAEQLGSIYNTRPALSPSWTYGVGKLGRAYYLNVLALRLALVAAPLWLLCALITRGKRESVAPVLRRSLLLSMCSAGIYAWALNLLWTHEVGDPLFLPDWDGGTNKGFLSLSGSLVPFWLTFGAWTIGNLLWRAPWKSAGLVLKRLVAFRPRLSFGPMRLQRVVVLAVIAFCALAVWAMWREGADVASFLWSDNAVWVLAPALCLALATSVVLIVRAGGKQRAARACFIAAFWVYVVPVLFGSAGPIASIAAAILLVAGLVFAGFRVQLNGSLRVRQNGSLKGWMGRFIVVMAAWLLPACAVLAIGASLVYVGLTLKSIPLERRAKAQLARQFQIGEAAFLREQLQTNSLPLTP